MDHSIEKECSALGGLFQSIVNDLKGAHPVWDDFAQKATKLHIQLKATIAAVNIFLDALQKIADMATGAKGATRDIGTALTRICMRHRSVENRLKTLCSSIIDCMVQPLSNKIDEWHRTALQMDKDHSKEYKKCRHEIRKRSQDTSKLQKKLRRGQNTVQRMLDSAAQEVNDRHLNLLDTERSAVRQVLIEQRSQYCHFVSWFKPVMDGEISLLSEIGQMTEVMEVLCKNSCDPYTLPELSEAVIADAKGLESTWRFKTPPSSPSGAGSLGSRKSSFCSLSSADSQTFFDDKSQRALSSSQQKPQTSSTNARYSSMSSKDSGFTSLDTLFRRPKSPRSSTMVTQYVQPARFNSDEEEILTPGGNAAQPATSSDSSGKSTPSPSPSCATWPDSVVAKQLINTATKTPDLVAVGDGGTSYNIHRPHTISAAGGSALLYKRQLLGAMTFVPPRPTTLFENDDRQASVKHMNQSNSLQETQTFYNKHFEMTMQNQSRAAASNFNKPVPNQILVQQPIYANAAQFNYQNDLCETSQNRRRPLSFVATGVDDFVTLAASFCNSDSSAAERHDVKTRKNSAARDDDEDTLTGDCTEQIDKLVGELDRYCELGDRTDFDDIVPLTMSSYCTLPRHASNCVASTVNYSQNTIVRRPAAVANRPPPPPIRRNSAITSATLNAPAVDVVRSGNSRCTTPIDNRSAIYNYNTAETPQYQHVPFGLHHQSAYATTDPNAECKETRGTATTPYVTTTHVHNNVRIRTAGCRNRSLPRV